MTNNVASLKNTLRFVIIAVLALIVSILPAITQAATFAYVNTAGEVSTTNADTPTIAIMTAPGIAVHSGVLLLTNPSDPIVGDDVSGI